MKEVIKYGESVDLVLKEACLELNCTKENVDFEILENGRKGFCGMFKKPFKVKVLLKTDIVNSEDVASDIASETGKTAEKTSKNNDKKVKTEKVATKKIPVNQEEFAEKSKLANDYICDILNKMGISNYKCDLEKTKKGLKINITCENEETSKIVVGRNGETIDSLQNLVNLAVNKREKTFLKVSMDCDGYRGNREDNLRKLAVKIANNVKLTGNSSTLDNMNAYDRRIVHAELQNMSGIKTKSVGEEPYRKVIIKSTAPKQEKKSTYDEKSSEDNTQKIKDRVNSTVKTKIFEKEDTSPLYSKIDLGQ